MKAIDAASLHNHWKLQKSTKINAKKSILHSLRQKKVHQCAKVDIMAPRAAPKKVRREKAPIYLDLWSMQGFEYSYLNLFDFLVGLNGERDQSKTGLAGWGGRLARNNNRSGSRKEVLAG